VLELDGKAFATIDLALWERFRPRVGEVFPERDGLLAASTALGAYDRALRMLASRGRPASDLVRKLVEKGEAQSDARAAVERLVGLGLVDDAAFARNFVRSKSSRLGVRRLSGELSRLGVARPVIEAAIASERPSDPEQRRDDLRALVDGRRRSLRSLAPDVAKRRLMGFLMRRGFSGAEVREALEHFARPVG